MTTDSRPGRTEANMTAERAQQVLARHLLVDGFDFVLDLERSNPRRLVNQRDGAEYLDLFTFFASNPIGMNHPALINDDQFSADLLLVARNKPSNSDIQTVAMARFVETFQDVMGVDGLPHQFNISGGALAVENVLKAAFDFKRRRNAAEGRDPRLGTKVLHLRRAFHGRSGYTLSLTNTKPLKTALFPTFDWPRIPTTPAVIGGSVARLERLEAATLAAARRAFVEHEDDIACTLVEPIQCEGGDNHLRAELLQPLQRLTHDNGALFAVDEVQSGMGVTGHRWAHQALGLEPDLLAFGKKAQVCGVLGGRRIDEEPQNVFRVSSRINSTWGGNLVDMVRAERVLRVIRDDNLIDNAAQQGAWMLHRLRELFDSMPSVTNLRGRGLLIAFDLPSAQIRNDVVAAARARRLLILSCGTRSIRLRPHLAVEREDLDEAAARLAEAVAVSVPRQ